VHSRRLAFVALGTAREGRAVNDGVQERAGRMVQKKLLQGLELSNFDLKDTLGTGSFGRVRMVQFTKDKQFYALKILKKSEVIYLKQVDHILTEKVILEVIEHPFIVNL